MRYDNGLRNPSIVRYFQQPVVPVLCIGIPAFVEMKRVLSPTFYTKALVAIFFSRLVTDASNEIIKDKLKKRKRTNNATINFNNNFSTSTKRASYNPSQFYHKYSPRKVFSFAVKKDISRKKITLLQFFHDTRERGRAKLKERSKSDGRSLREEE